MSGLSRGLGTTVITIIVAGGVVVLGLWAYRARDEMTTKRDAGVYRYQIEKYARVDLQDVLYKEEPPVAVKGDILRAVAVDAQDRIYVAVDKRVVLFGREGALEGEFFLPGSATCMTVDFAGNMYLGVSSRLIILGADGKRRAMWDSLGEKAVLTSIALVDDCVVIADSANKVLWWFDKEGRLIKMLGRDGGGVGPRFVIPSAYFDIAAVKDEDAVWVVNPGELKVLKLNSEGEVEAEWGGPSMELLGFCGCCNPSHLALLPSGGFVTSEKGIPRVKLYGNDGGFLGVVAPPSKFDERVQGLDLAVDSNGRVLVLDPDKKQVRIFTRKEIEVER